MSLWLPSLVLIAGLLSAQVGPPETAGSFQLSDLEKTLRSSPEARERIQAAVTLERLWSTRAVTPLRDALTSEKDPAVVDAIVGALGRLRTPFDSPETCREIATRCWEADVAQPLFDCWRASVSPGEVLNAAVSAPPVLRALALRSLSATGSQSESGAAAPGGAAHLSADTRERLLASTVEVLSREEQMASSTKAMLQQALWDLSGRDMAEALRHADRVAQTDLRYFLSYAFSLREPAAYYAYRRPRQLLAAVLLAVPFSVLFLWSKRFRRPAGLLTASALGWGLWSLICSDVRQLPPQPLPFLTASFLSFLSAGIAAILVGFLPWQRITSGRRGTFGRVGLGAAAAGILAAVLCAWTRSAGLFPVVNSGWDIFIESFGSLHLGILAGGVLTFGDTLISGRNWGRQRA